MARKKGSKNKTYKNPIDRFMKLVEKTDNCWNYIGAKNGIGYGSFYYNNTMIGAHIFSFITFKNKNLNGLCVLHTCDNPKCVNPDHLYLGTKKQNALDRENRNRGNHATGDKHGSKTCPNSRLSGEQHPCAKLKEDDIIFIRNNYKFRSKQYNSVTLGKMFGVHPSIIMDIYNGNLWKNIGINYVT